MLELVLIVSRVPILYPQRPVDIAAKVYGDLQVERDLYALVSFHGESC